MEKRQKVAPVVSSEIKKKKMLARQLKALTLGDKDGKKSNKHKHRLDMSSDSDSDME